MDKNRTQETEARKQGYVYSILHILCLSINNCGYVFSVVIPAMAGIQYFERFWIPRSSRGMTNPEFMARLQTEVL
ncbi:MAG: hypothetical protein AB1442_01360 [Nitrospirota bacterium]